MTAGHHLLPVHLPIQPAFRTPAEQATQTVAYLECGGLEVRDAPLSPSHDR